MITPHEQRRKRASLRLTGRERSAATRRPSETGGGETPASSGGIAGLETTARER